MSYGPNQMYPGATELDPNYPKDKFKDNNPSTTNNGTPLKAIKENQDLALETAIMNEAGFEYSGILDTPINSQLFKAYQAALTSAKPINNDWNGYLDPAHQEELPSPAGYPATSGSGGTVYALNDEWSLNCFCGSAGNTISSDADGVVFSGSIYKKYEYTAEQIALLDVDKVPIFVKAQDGKAFYFKNGDTGVTVSKVGTTLTVTLDDSIFAVTGVDRVWRFFVTDKVGSVAELSVEALFLALYSNLKLSNEWSDVTASRTAGVAYTTGPMPIDISVVVSGQSCACQLVVESLGVDRSSGNFTTSGTSGISCTIPPQSQYSVIVQVGTLESWTQLG